jgi:cation diffusion facilitator CzcD-associated flavoprotein CzcO
MSDHTIVQSESCFDVIIVGAGISGINAAYRLQDQLPNFSYAMLEAREDLGGTWDLFRYPGIRSDSDLFTFGFAFNPWNQNNPIAEGYAIKQYMRDTAQKYGIDEHILFRHHLLSADWSTTNNTWSLAVNANGVQKTITARFVIFGTGYYDYKQPLQAKIPGLDNFQGQVIHPQFWPEDLDYKNKKVVIIGSGATAITLLPNMANEAAHVTMLQRSPTYIYSVPNRKTNSRLSYLLPSPSYLLPSGAYHRLQRAIWILRQRMFFLFCQRFPSLSTWILKRGLKKELPGHISYDPHFKPNYNPWDQRMCVCPDGDFFASLRCGKADIRTDTIKTVTEKGIVLKGGETLNADIIITATGLKLQIGGGVILSVDKQQIDIGSKFLWNGVMLQDLPNAAFVIGYTNASWTLGADAIAQCITRILKTLESRKFVAAIPRVKANDAQKLQDRPLLQLKSTYVTTGAHALPRAADRGPWQPRDHYGKDIRFARKGNLDDGLEFVQGSNLHLRKRVT